MAEDPLKAFVRDSLQAGHDRDQIHNVLKEAGWSGPEIRNALSQYSEINFIPPVPRPARYYTARDAFINAILFASMAVSAWYFVELVHTIIDLYLPGLKAPDYYFERYQRTRLRWAIAVLAISVPFFIWITIATNRWIVLDPGKMRSPVRKWLAYVTLFTSALVFLSDGTYAIYAFLMGETTLRFLLKAMAVATVSLGIFLYYLRDVEGDGDEN